MGNLLIAGALFISLSAHALAASPPGPSAGFTLLVTVFNHKTGMLSAINGGAYESADCCQKAGIAYRAANASADFDATGDYLTVFSCSQN